MSADSDQYKLFVYSIAGGLTLFYLGLKKLKICKHMEDVPTSKIASAALGSLVEVQGRVICEEKDFVVSPLTGRRGACFIIELEKKIKSGKSSKWVKVFRFYSLPYLYISDGGQDLAMVDLAHCDFHDELFNQKNYYFNDYSFEIEDSVKEWLEDNKILDVSSRGSFLSTQQYRLKEKIFKRHDLIYVLGPAVAPPSDEIKVSSHPEIFGKRDQDLHHDVNLIYNEIVRTNKVPEEYDLNNDQHFDDKELKKLYNDVQKKMFADFNKSVDHQYLKKSKIFFTMMDDHESLFSLKKVNISFQPEHKIIRKLILQGWGMVVLGPLIILAGIYLTFFEN